MLGDFDLCTSIFNELDKDYAITRTPLPDPIPLWDVSFQKRKMILKTKKTRTEMVIFKLLTTMKAFKLMNRTMKL